MCRFRKYTLSQSDGRHSVAVFLFLFCALIFRVCSGTWSGFSRMSPNKIRTHWYKLMIGLCFPVYKTSCPLITFFAVWSESLTPPPFLLSMNTSSSSLITFKSPRCRYLKTSSVLGRVDLEGRKGCQDEAQSNQNCEAKKKLFYCFPIDDVETMKLLRKTATYATRRP